MANGNNSSHFVNVLIGASVSAFITLGTLFIYAGGLMNRVDENEKRTEKLENSINYIQQNMVNKDDLREVRIDIKTLLQQSNSRDTRDKDRDNRERLIK
jgi:hypothetical protein